MQSWATQLGKESDPFDYAIYVAGVVDDWADLEEVDEGKMLYCFKVNAIGALLVAQTLVENSLLRSGSVLVNLTSKMGSLADNSSGGSYAYVTLIRFQENVLQTGDSGALIFVVLISGTAPAKLLSTRSQSRSQ